MPIEKSSQKSNISGILCTNIRSICKSRGLKQTEVAEAIGEKVKTVNKWFTGTSVPSAEQLVRIADYLDISLDKLVGRTPRAAEPLVEARRHLGSVLGALDSILPVDSGEPQPTHPRKKRGRADAKRSQKKKNG